jgi:glycosyltransferase involved in cell wall biosynthesis
MTPVSIGIPFTDQTTDLSLAIRSVLNQTYTDWELILYGDGPSEDALAMARSFTDSRISVYDRPSRLGLARTLNEIATLARYPLLARMDGDDIMHPTRIERQVSKFKSDRTIDVLGTNAYIVDEDTNLVGAFVEPQLPASRPGFLRSNAFSHPTVMARTAWFLENPYDEKLLRAQDKELWLRTCEVSNFSKLDDRLVYYRVSRQMSAARLRRNESYNREIMRMYAWVEPSPASQAVRLARSYAKELIFLGADLKLLSNYLYERKWMALSDVEREEAESHLRRIVHT